MSATATTQETSVHESTLRPLVLIEARRFLRHPAFLIGLTACFVVTAMGAPKATPDSNSGVLAAFFIGVVTMLVTYHQTRSNESSREALDSTPTSVTQCTAAMCFVCLVPAAFGALWLASFYLTQQIWPLEAWMFGTFSGTDSFAILLGQSVVACLGAPVLGVAAARWLNFRGGSLVLVVGTVALVVAGLLEGWRSDSWNLRMLTPFTFFTDTRINPDAEDSLPGSPWWYLGLLLAYCALGVIAALLRGAEPRLVSRLKVAGSIGLVAALTCGLLAVTGGLDQSVRTYPDGRSIIQPVGG